MSKNTFRNRLAHRIANFAFHYIADDDYEAEVEAYISYGLRSMVRDHMSSIPGPPSFEELGIVQDWMRHQ